MPTFHIYPDPDGSGMVFAKSEESDLIVRAPSRSHAQRHVLNGAEVGQHGLSEESEILFEHHTDTPSVHERQPSYLTSGEVAPAPAPTAPPAFSTTTTVAQEDEAL